MKKCLVSLMLALSFLTACEKDYETSKADELDYAFVNGDCEYVINELSDKQLAAGSREEKMLVSSLMQCAGTSLFSIITNLDNKGSGDYYSILRSILNVDSLTKDNIAALRANYDQIAKICKNTRSALGSYADSSVALTCAMGEANAASVELFGILTELNGDSPIELSEEGIKGAIQGKRNDEIKSAIEGFYGLEKGQEENDKINRLNDIVDNLNASINDPIITDTLKINTDEIKGKIDEAKGSSGKVTATSLLNFILKQK